MRNPCVRNPIRDERKKMVREGGLEPPRSPTRSEVLRVCQFRHSRAFTPNLFCSNIFASRVPLFYHKKKAPGVKPLYYKRSFFYRPSPNTVNARPGVGESIPARYSLRHLIGPIKWGKVRHYDTQTALQRYLPEISGEQRRPSRV